MDNVNIEAVRVPQISIMGSGGSGGGSAPMSGGLIYKTLHYRATVNVSVRTDMGIQELLLGANGSTREKALEHVQALYDRAVLAIKVAAQIPNGQ